MLQFLAERLPILAAAAILLLGYVAVQKYTLYLRRREFKKLHGCQPIAASATYKFKDPILNSDWIRESLRALKRHELLEQNCRRCEKYGDTIKTWLFWRPAISTRDHENIKTVLSTRFQDFALGPTRPTLLQPLGAGIFTTDGDHWAYSRKMIRPNFVREQVGDIAMFERHVQELLKQVPTDGSTVDLQELFFRLTIDSATEFLFGESIESQKQHRLTGDQSSDEGFAYAWNYALNIAAYRSRLGPFDIFYRNQKGKDMDRAVHAFADGYIEKALRERVTKDTEKNTPESYVFLHELIKQTKDKERLRAELLNVLLAGRDTTASLLGNLFFMLAKHPEVYAKLRREIQTELQGKLPTYEQLRNLKYLKYCLNESLRIHPLVPGNTRRAMVDTVLPRGGGPDGTSPIFVPAGTNIIYHTYALHHRKDLYGADADDFRPERWETLRPGWEYIPFNGGPRICLGQQYALTEAGYVTLRLVQEFGRCEDRNVGQEWQENLTLTLCSLHGAKVGLYREDQVAA